METLTVEQVLALAPDASSTKAGQGLANPAKWVSLGRKGRSVWGACQGSGKDPYRTQVDLTGPAFHCSCPSRKFPCKHGLGLLLLLVGNSARVPEGAEPPWVVEWIAKRDASAEKKAQRAAAEDAPPDPETAAKREQDRERRAAKREERVRAGMEELQTWLDDLLRQGLAHAKQQPSRFFDTMAARMIDAQAPGVARRLKEFPGILASGNQWADRALEEAGSLQLLIHGFTRLADLPEALRASVRSVIGWTTNEEELAGAEIVSDQWQIVGRRIEEEEKLRVQRTWLAGANTKRLALCLSFAAGNQPLDTGLPAGSVVDADIAFYPSGAPLRAMVREKRALTRTFGEPAACRDFNECLETAAAFFAGDPFIERVPWYVRDCIPAPVNDQWLLVDMRGNSVPIASRFANAWQLFAISGGAPIAVFGEWNGHELSPLGAISEGRFISLGGVFS